MLDFNRMSDNGTSSTAELGILDMEKGGILDLVKDDKSLENIKAGLGWDMAPGTDNYDLDLAAFMLGNDGKIHSNQIANRVVYFKSMGDVNRIGVQLMGDNRNGDGDGDDEEMNFILSKIPSDVSSIVIVASIYKGVEKHQTFKKIDNSYIRLLDMDNHGEVICRYQLKEEFQTETFVYLGKLYRDRDIWKFQAIGEGGVGSIETALMKYYAQ